jgi:hypothetical protein
VGPTSLRGVLNIFIEKKNCLIIVNRVCVDRNGVEQSRFETNNMHKMCTFWVVFISEYCVCV